MGCSTGHYSATCCAAIAGQPCTDSTGLPRKSNSCALLSMSASTSTAMRSGTAPRLENSVPEAALALSCRSAMGTALQNRECRTTAAGSLFGRSPHALCEAARTMLRAFRPDHQVLRPAATSCRWQLTLPESPLAAQTPPPASTPSAAARGATCRRARAPCCRRCRCCRPSAGACAMPGSQVMKLRRGRNR